MTDVFSVMAPASRMADMISDLLTLTRLRSPQVSSPVSVISIQTVAESCMDLACVLAVQRGKTAVLQSPDREIQTEGNEELLKTALDNLLVNGIRHAKERIVLRLKTENDRVKICVCDDGPGIDPENLPHLFDRFYTGTDGHFGLGLPIAQSAVELMGGSITVENGPGGGAVFTVTLKKTHET